MKTVTASIDLSALDYNMSLIANKVSNSKLIAIVKANAYGHGSIECVHVMDRYVQGYAVARIEEAIELRDAGVNKEILMLGGFVRAEDLSLIEKYDLSFAIHSIWQIEAIENYHPNKPLKGWCQVNIGMQRLGFNEDELKNAITRIKQTKNLLQPVGMMSHLSCADSEMTNQYNLEQIKTWERMSSLCEGALCLANSAGCLYFPQTQTEFVRPGIIQYGISPSGEQTGEQLGLKPVMTLSSFIMDIRTVEPGDVVGYSAAWKCTETTKIAILAIGYADGYPRAMPNGSPVLINGRFAKTVGHVCMDMMFVDLGIDSNDKIGDKAVLWGKGLPAELIANRVNSIAYELVTGLSSRVEYKYIK